MSTHANLTGMGLDRADSRPPYQQIADVLRQGIINGQYSPGDLLPSTRELMHEFGVSKGTATAAVKLLQAEKLVTGWQGKGVVVRDLLGAVPQGFPAAALEGAWVTAYEFTHAGKRLCHADIAHVTARSVAELQARNYPPEPRTEGRAVGFRNEISGRLASRHLLGQWRNTSDTRYFGSLHLAVQPGETVMDGWYTGLASDITVSMGQWKWVRLDAASGGAPATLREPRELWEMVMAHEADGPALALDETGETG
jgi:hypothetical protein